MAKTEQISDKQWVSNQVKRYAKVFPRYKTFAVALQQALQTAVKKHAPLAIVQTRPKAIASFAGKIQRKRAEYANPVKELTDLCGGRVITHFRSEVAAVCKFIEEHFEIDWDNSQDVVKRLQPSEFGYRSVHYIVSFRKGVFVDKKGKDEIPAGAYGLKGEIQVRTILEHAWADFTHDMSYKSAFPIPEKWTREIARLAAALEETDNAFERIRDGLQSYGANYGAYLSEEQVRKQIINLKVVLAHDKKNLELVARIGNLALAVGDWDETIGVLSKYVKSGHVAILRDLGVALCKKHQGNKKSRKYRDGQRYLAMAAAPENSDADAIASFAGTWKGVDNDKAREFYRRAYEADPGDAYPLANYLDLEILHKKSASVVSLMTPMIEAAIERCEKQADVGVNLPWAYYSIGKFKLLQKNPYESLAAYAKAVQLSSAPFMIETSLASINQLAVVESELPGLGWVRLLLTAGLIVQLFSRRKTTARKTETARTAANAAKKNLQKWAKEFPRNSKEMTSAREEADKAQGLFGQAHETHTNANREYQQALSKYIVKPDLVSKPSKPIKGPVVIVVGGCDEDVEKRMQAYGKLLGEAFSSFRGSVISGGTTSGIPGLVGELGEKYPDTIRTIGYLPKGHLPQNAQPDKRYTEIRCIAAKGFSPLEPLQNWIDIVAAGIDPGNVKILGINGGEIAAAEYRIALALGARVGIITGSGREAAKLLPDNEWGAAGNLLRLPSEAMTVKAFIGSGQPKLAPKMRETFAVAIHEQYRKNQAKALNTSQPSMAEWPDLPELLKESNRQQADDIFEKLRSIRCQVNQVTDRKIAVMSFTKSEIEIMAEIEHARWNIERLQDGWQIGTPKDVKKKISPYLVSWQELPEDVKEWDRQAVRAIPKLLADAGLEIRRNQT